jgi:hypothetical protein
MLCHARAKPNPGRQGAASGCGSVEGLVLLWSGTGDAKTSRQEAPYAWGLWHSRCRTTARRRWLRRRVVFSTSCWRKNVNL